MIIGFGYKARRGKDEAAGHLVRAYGFERRAFADPLKEAAKAVFHLTEDQVYGRLKSSVDPFWGVSPRYLLQVMGTECMRRGYSPDVWVKSFHRYMLLRKDVKDWVISDVRFLNEAEAIKSWGGMVIRLDRDVAEENVGGIGGHSSEYSLDFYRGWDMVINNNASLYDLFNRLDGVMKDLHVEKKA